MTPGAAAGGGGANRPTGAAPTIPGLRRLLYANSALVLVIGVPLYLLSDRTDTWFAWTIRPPLTAAVLGAGYWASFVMELLSARERLWARTRPAVPAVLLFSTLTLAITLLYADRFHFRSPQPITQAGTWVWLVVYVSVPVAMGCWSPSGGGPGRTRPGSLPCPAGSGSRCCSRRRSCCWWACRCCWSQRWCSAPGLGS
jgi:hypothetical protein